MHIGLKANHAWNANKTCNFKVGSARAARVYARPPRGLRLAKATTQVLTSESLSRHNMVQILLTSFGQPILHPVAFRGCEAAKHVSCNSYPPNSLMSRICAVKICKASLLSNIYASTPAGNSQYSQKYCFISEAQPASYTGSLIHVFHAGAHMGGTPLH